MFDLALCKLSTSQVDYTAHQKKMLDCNPQGQQLIRVLIPHKHTPSYETHKAICQ